MTLAPFPFLSHSRLVGGLCKPCNDDDMAVGHPLACPHRRDGSCHELAPRTGLSAWPCCRGKPPGSKMIRLYSRTEPNTPRNRAKNGRKQVEILGTKEAA